MEFGFNWSNLTIPGLTQQCTGRDYYTVECLNKLFCPQIKSWLINTGVVLIAVYILHLYVIDWLIIPGLRLYLKQDHNLLWIEIEISKIRYWLKDRVMDALAIFIFLIVVMYR